MTRRRRRRVLLAIVAFVVAAGAAAGGALAAFISVTSSAGNRVTAAPDFRAPTASASVVLRAGGSVPGFVKPGGSYSVYANAADTGNPASGVSTVSADMTALTAGASAASLASGSFPAGGVTYGYRSGALAVDAGAGSGAKTYSLALADVAGNSAVQGGFGVTVDGTPPTGVDVQTTNGGGALGVGGAGQGDTVVYTLSEPLDPVSVLAGWNGSATNVSVRLLNGPGLLPPLPDSIVVYDAANATQLPLGSIDLGRNDYATLGDTLFGTAGTPSTMVMTGNTITVTLGALNGLAINIGAGSGTMTWTPSASAQDRAGNAMSTTAVTETGATDREF